MKNISNDPTSPSAPCMVSANQVAHQLLINSRGTMSNTSKRPVRSPPAEESMVYPFSEEEYRRGIATLKNNKAAGIDDVLAEQLKNIVPKTHKWLLAMLTTASLRKKSQQYGANRRSSPYYNPGKTLRHLKVIPSVPHVQTIRTIDPEQNSTHLPSKNTSSRNRPAFHLESHVQVNC